MSALAVADTLFDRPDDADERTLEELVRAAWNGVARGKRVACPVCDGELEPRYGAHSRPVAARCGECGTVLT